MAVTRFRNVRPVHAGHRVARHRISGSTREPAWFRIIKPLFLVLFTVLFFLLVYSMSHHGFFSGGTYSITHHHDQPYAP